MCKKEMSKKEGKKNEEKKQKAKKKKKETERDRKRQKETKKKREREERGKWGILSSTVSPGGRTRDPRMYMYMSADAGQKSTLPVCYCSRG